MLLHDLDRGTSIEQVAKLRFVPKNVKTMRSICMEPISRMYLQQEVMRWLGVSMKQSHLNRIVDLTKQDHNRRYAYHGSYSNSCDTIDLSAASDRLHVKLVKRVFPAKVLYYLLGTRTHCVNTDQGMIELNKFAPMGSALCFPVQCIVFSAITLLAYLKQHYKLEPMEDPSEDWFYLHHINKFIDMMHDKPEEILPNLLTPRVYGDDIICDYRTTDNVLVLLAQCGLRVNSEKSFIGGSPFRESCGIFAYNGEDVTPYLFRVPTFKTKLNANVLASVIDQANRAGDYGYNHLRSTLINFLKRSSVEGIKGNITPYIPFTTSRLEFGIYTTNLQPSKVVRESVRYQREEKKVLVLRNISDVRYESPHMEKYAYDQWMRARIRGGSTEDNFSVSRIRPRVTRVRLGWTPV